MTSAPGMTKLKDLATRAGRWLGLGTPPPLHTQAIEADRFDQMEWREIRDQAGALRQMTSDLGETHDYAADLLQDVWTGAYKSSPHLRDAAQMEPSRRVNHQVMASLLASPEFEDLRRETAGDSYAAAMAVISQRHRISQLLEKAEDAQEAARQAEQARQEAADAAQAVADALEQAAQQADGDGELPHEDAQAVLDAIAAAQQADQAADAAGAAADDALGQAAPAMRAIMRAAAADAAEQAREEAAVMAAWGVGPGQLERMDFTARRLLAQRLSTGKLGQFAKLIGRFRTMATGERTRKMENVPGELVGITLGADVSRLIPSELANLGVPALRAVFAAKLAEDRLMVYETRGEDHAGQGAIIACVDCSYSMCSPQTADGTTGEAYAKALALALLDQARASRRDFVAILFSSPPRYDDYTGELLAPAAIKTFHFPADQSVRIEDVVEMAEHFFGGGTDYMAPLDEAADVLEAQYSADGTQKGDIVFITDGECDVTEDWMSTWNDRKHQLGHRVFGVSVGEDPGLVLDALSDNLHTVHDLTETDATRDLFRVI